MREMKKKSKKCSEETNYHQQYYLSNKDKYSKRRAEWRIKNPERTKFLYAKADSKRRKLEFALDFEWLKIFWQQGCTYCGKNLLLEKGISADRLDNELGYTITNIVPCCGTCNSIKSNILTHDEMKVAMKAIIELRKTLGEV